jgi:hypothetical protein
MTPLRVRRFLCVYADDLERVSASITLDKAAKKRGVSVVS